MDQGQVGEAGRADRVASWGKKELSTQWKEIRDLGKLLTGQKYHIFTRSNS